MSTSLTLSEFRERATSTHNGAYSYTKSVYRSSTTNIIITCQIHGDFEQKPVEHLRGHGCKACGMLRTSSARRLDTQSFTQRANAKHGGKYDYRHTEYINNRKKVSITCPDHGVFEQTPADHLAGKGCRQCGFRVVAEGQRLDTPRFIQNAIACHGTRYDYSKSVFVDNVSKVLITCSEHGDFEQSPANHTQGSGCPKCAVTGYKPGVSGYVYFLLDTQTQSRLKIGITNNPTQRFSALKYDTPFTFEPLEVIRVPGSIAPELERLCHQGFESSGLRGFNGATEWFNFNGKALRQAVHLVISFSGLT